MQVSYRHDSSKGPSPRRDHRHESLYHTPDIELELPARRPDTSSGIVNGASLGAMLCLLATGALLGISTNLAKVAGAAALPPLAFLAWSTAGASLVLLVVAWVRGTLPPLTARTLEYYVLSAFLTVAASNLIVFSAVPHVGASFIAPLIALPPLLTYVGALFLGLETFNARRATGVVLALVGVSWIALLKLIAPESATFWILLTLACPVLFAIGNLYRSLRWPAGLSADALAPGMLVAAALMLFAAGLLPYPVFSLTLPNNSVLPILLVLTQTIVFAGQFLLLLELQRRGGPVYLSLFGSVGALVGIPIAVLLLGERTPEGLAIGAGLIGIGITLLSMKDRKRSRAHNRPERESPSDSHRKHLDSSHDRQQALLTEPAISEESRITDDFKTPASATDQGSHSTATARASSRGSRRRRRKKRSRWKRKGSVETYL